MGNKKRFIAIIIGILLPLIVLITAIEFASFDKNFFMNQVKENNVVKNTGIAEADMESVVDEILSYLRGTRTDFDIKAHLTEKGITSSAPVSIFNEQEMVHMDDVRALLNMTLTIRNIALLIFFIASVYLLKNSKTALIKGLFYGSAIALVIILTIGGIFTFNFDGTFTLFHQLFFFNDLWLMDPNTDLLIWIVPGPFFFNLIARMVLYAVIPLALTGIGTGILLFKKNR